jgi:hypothetical protein
MPFVALAAHKMLTEVASLRMAFDLLADPATDESQRARLIAVAARQLDGIEETLKELIVAPRDLHTDPTGDPTG